MLINSVISSFNDDVNYMEFVGLTCQAWKKLTGIRPCIAYIMKDGGERDGSIIRGIQDMNVEHGGLCNLYVFRNMEGMDYGVQAKITRLWLAQALPGTHLIADIDMIPLSDKILHYGEGVPSDHLIQFGYDHPSFQVAPDIGKWPMDKTTATRKTFKQIINPKNLGQEELFKSWTGFPGDMRSNVWNPFSGFSDESLLCQLWRRWDDKDTRTTRVPRKGMPVSCLETGLYGRLDRSSISDTTGVDLSRYFEVHGPRPLTENFDWYDPIIDYVRSI